MYGPIRKMIRDRRISSKQIMDRRPNAYQYSDMYRDLKPEFEDMLASGVDEGQSMDDFDNIMRDIYQGNMEEIWPYVEDMGTAFDEGPSGKLVGRAHAYLIEHDPGYLARYNQWKESQ